MLPGMRLLPRVATMWQHASSRLAPNLVPRRILAGPFAPISTTILHIKHLHDDKKKSDTDLAKEFKGLTVDGQIKLEAPNPVADFESASK